MNRRSFICDAFAVACVAGAGSVLADMPHEPRHHKPHPHSIECPRCEGTGRVRRNWLGFTKRCPECNGSGRKPLPPPKPQPLPPVKPQPKPLPKLPPKPQSKPHAGQQHGGSHGSPQHGGSQGAPGGRPAGGKPNAPGRP